jgi:hypothetical protein
MKVLHIHDNSKIHVLNDSIKSGKHVFMLIYMNGCGPCNLTRPEWKKIENVLHKNSKNPKYKDVVVVDIDMNYVDKVLLENKPISFPTMKHIYKKENIEENYEERREIDAFMKWINSKLPSKSNKSINKSNKTTKPHHHQNGGRKWTRKYKRSINCKRPRGFSQKQYCKYGRK